MAEKTLGPLPRYWTIGQWERNNLARAMKKPLSGYIGGHPTEGYWVKKLSEDWKETFWTKYAIPCNSATSGLMAACMAANIGPGDEVWVSTYTMSATATCAMILGATVKFLDIDAVYFCMTTTVFMPPPKAIIVTNLFGCAAHLNTLRNWCDKLHVVMIEDNAQAPFATCGGTFTGTIGHMGVFSLNVHKHMQCGEGGVVVTDDAGLADAIELAINHGELRNGEADQYHLRAISQMGLNLRMTEPIAAIACAQLKKGFNLVQSRIALAEFISDIFRGVEWVRTPTGRCGEVHAYYLWAGQITGANACDIRNSLVTRLRERGIPFKAGYSVLLHRLFEDNCTLPVAEDIEDNRLFTFEVCAYDPKVPHLRMMREIIREEADHVGAEQKQRSD